MKVAGAPRLDRKTWGDPAAEDAAQWDPSGWDEAESQEDQPYERREVGTFGFLPRHSSSYRRTHCWYCSDPLQCTQELFHFICGEAAPAAESASPWRFSPEAFLLV
jgi:hypothetical protein